jgi:WS/DGAT/MGAT family acyltransferase
MHVAGVMIFEGSPPPYDELLASIERRLGLVPRYRQRLAFVPFAQGRPKWVDDPHLNLRYHVRSTALPSPGSEQQLKELAGRVFSQQLDRDKPLWEIWLVDGLEGDRFAMLSKTHHSLVDGVSGVDIMSVLFGGAAGHRRPLAAPTAPLRGAAARRGACGARNGAHGDRSLGPRRAARPAHGGGGHSRRRPRPTTSRSGRTGASPGCA